MMVSFESVRWTIYDFQGRGLHDSRKSDREAKPRVFAARIFRGFKEKKLRGAVDERRESE